jgi:hypothetical protein
MDTMTTYTVTERMGCRLVQGDIPLQAMASLGNGMPKDAVMDAHAARMLDVILALGRPADLKALCSDPLVREAAHDRARIVGAGLSESAIEWLAFGEQGLSSKAIFQHLTGVIICRAGSEKATPSDPSDLARCRKLLDRVPEFQPRLHELANISPAWRNLVAEWTDLCASMDRELPKWRERGGSMPSTYAQMCALSES